MKKLTAFLMFCLFTFYFCLAFASQNALVVPDGTGAQVRAGFNNALDTLNTVNSGPAAPATTEAYMLWADTANNLLKQRDAANATWIILGTLGVAQMGHEPAITAGTTSQYWRGDKTWQTLPSGMSYPGAGVPLSTGSAWGTSYIVGTGANDLVQLNSSGQLPALDGSQLTNLPAASVPPGVIVQYAGSVAPSGWLLCQGQEVSTTTYANLYAAIGTTYGSGSGTFGIPNMQIKFPLGAGTGYALGSTGGSTTGASQGNSLGSPSTSNNSGALYESSNLESTYDLTSGITVGAQSIMPPYQVVNYIIKY
jgi:hypothetical protein